MPLSSCRKTAPEQNHPKHKKADKFKEIENWTSQDWRQDRGGAWVTKRGELSWSRTSGWLVSEKRIYVEVLCVG